MAKTISIWTKNWMIKNKIPFYFLELATSSNDLAKEKAFKNLASPTVFLVDKQTKGRGYENKTWENSDLMISFLWEQRLRDITLSSCKDFALDLQEALKEVWPQLNLWVKAPNDLYLNEGKTAGLLLEILNQGSKKALIVGLGFKCFFLPGKFKGSLSCKANKEHQ